MTQPSTNASGDNLALMMEAHKKMDDIEKEAAPLRSRLSWLERQWEIYGRDASRYYIAMLNEKGNKDV